jgi:hypothetical protein
MAGLLDQRLSKAVRSTALQNLLNSSAPPRECSASRSFELERSDGKGSSRGLRFCLIRSKAFVIFARSPETLEIKNAGG